MWYCTVGEPFEFEPGGVRENQVTEATEPKLAARKVINPAPTATFRSGNLPFLSFEFEGFKYLGMGDRIPAVVSSTVQYARNRPNVRSTFVMHT